ncbi:hydrolase [Thermaurantimonas aggregans]|uniref:Hydrolase n=1 Tax=Thermaurantimonas aggregans TaxID=2173829 RepID=A0A401XJ38_9FLAO|nr:MBL fold metallo-hydrolase [Thermaurantimonas aggregans]MCX8148971.1 MBL fold metallo-hydrolase [Thermaurantimonas aggregans]GCD77013.1 hydrolase [Thermaurantimonas aggregans]
MSCKVIFTGTGTSQGIPVIGCKCPVCTSQNPRDRRTRTSVHVIVGDIHLQVDVGPDFRQQMLANQLDRVDAVLLTHEHMDHLAGIDDLRPLIFNQKRPMPIYGTSRVLKVVRQQFPYAFASEEDRYPGAPELKAVEIDGQKPFKVEGVSVIPLPVLHGNWPVLGFRMGNFSYITDANQIPNSTYALLRGSEYLVLNALRKEPHYSHFTLDEAIDVAKKVGARHTFLTHISHDMGLEEEVSRMLPAGISLAYDGLVVEC